TAFAKRPTPNAEKTARNGGCGGGIACSITWFQAAALAITDTRLSAIAATTHSQATNRKASATRCQFGPRQMKNATIAENATITRTERPHVALGSFTPR